MAFKLTSQTTGESHILVTDQNGEVRTETKWNPHTQNTNGNDEKPEAEWNDETGTWFGKTTEDWMVETQDGLCALPYDYYTATGRSWSWSLCPAMCPWMIPLRSR